MTDEEKKKLLDDYHSEVMWLRDHVPLDDIYEFSQQLRMNAEFFLGRLMLKTDVMQDLKTDKMLANYVRNLVALEAMRVNDYQGTINTDIEVLECEDYNPR